MKRNKVAKRFGIASLCLATAISAISGLSLLNNDVATAEGITDVTPVSLITADATATVTYEDGVRVSSDAAYEEGKFNYTFSGDTTLKFAFPETRALPLTWCAGNFVVRVASASDETNYFEIAYTQSGAWDDSTKGKLAYTIAHVCWGNEVRGRTNWSNTDFSTTQGSYWVNSKNNDSLTSPYFNNWNTNTGILSLVWEDDVLAVKVNRHNNSDMKVLAKFDGTYDTTAENNGFIKSTDITETDMKWGLPKLDFSDGYVVSFSSSFENANTTDKATDVCFKEIKTGGTTYTLSSNTNTETLTIAERGSEYTDVAVGDVLTIPAANVEVENVQLVKPNGVKKNVEAGETYTVAEKGLHTVTYTTAAGSVAAFSFVAKEYVATTDFVHTAATVTQDSAGLRISSDDAYKATLKGVYTGDTTLKFSFPETYTDWFDGNFVIRVTDATDDSNYFEIKYKMTDKQYRYTGAFVLHNGQVRTSQFWGSTTNWKNIEQNGEYALASPTFRNYRTQEGILSLVWNGDILQVQVNRHDNANMRTIAAFDDTSDFVSGTSWGLPKMSFEKGYVISVSSSFENAATADNGTDVLFSSIENDDVTYDFTAANIEKDSQMEAFNETFDTLTTEQAATGKVFLGWKATDGKLYPAYSVLKKQAGVSYEAVVISYDTINGASVRIDTSVGGQSGIRFQTLFNVDEYAAVKDYIQFGTLIAWTDTLTDGVDFTYENYKNASAFAKVENTTGVFDYTDKQGNTYKAYSMALTVNPENYTKAYSARGYLVVAYADGTTQTIHTDYNDTDNSRSIAQVANLLKTTDETTYNGMTDAQRAIIDAYIAALA